jgi:ribosomal protein L11 methyltransferase
MLELFPEGFEEVESSDGVELVAYTDSGGEERLWHAFGGARTEKVAADWRDRWKAFHEPVEIGPLWIGPPWAEAPAGATAITIEPGRAFGTGAHATTRLCIELLLELEPGSVVDLGCGSGVVAIAAAKLGFAPVDAVDSDEHAVAATRANAAANGVELDAAIADVLADGPSSADVAVANITRAALEQLALRVRARHLVGSGYLQTAPTDLSGWRHLRRLTREGWAADLYEAAQ